ncbi:ABC transporter ATP-binding protein [Companilactobacillus sp. HBUAS56275]|uniref:ABC transporter ATP-binding protein n=1 Tax=Candidatus Companilactobacillus pullicola TaxID=2838523 RepID=A0A9D2CPN3_9LACO|nr:ABC transporter ATP-binding protein [Candidatus Companilactobacillus pullicola]
MSPILEISHIKKSFKHRIILNDISFNLQPGSVVALVGANGAGKTTLMNIILNLLPSDSGQVKAFSDHDWREITGVMMQDNLSLGRIKVKEIINLSRSYFKHPLPFQKLLSLSGLETLENNYMNQLSGGQKRRLAFALSLSGNPDILFLDEPTVGMDSNARHDFWQEISKLRESGKTIFVTSHYLEELENIADRFLILQNGVIAFDGSIQSLRNIQGNSLVEFDSKLNINTFSNFQSIISIDRLGQHFQIVTNDPNKLITSITPYLAAINNLQVKQTNLDTMLLNYQEGHDHD